MQVEPAVFYQPEELLRETKARIHKVSSGDCTVDYVSFVPDGEPTLDRNLGTLIAMLKGELHYPVAIFTSGSLLWREEVAEAVGLADWVSVTVDTVVEPVWRRINRPDSRLEFSTVLEGIRSFASNYRGKLVSETMLVDQENTTTEELKQLAAYLKEISPTKAYLSTPYRSAAKSGVRIPDAKQLDGAQRCFEQVGLEVQRLTRPEGGKTSVGTDSTR